MKNTQGTPVKTLKPPPPPNPKGSPASPDDPVVYGASVAFGTAILTVDVIKYGGHNWLVPTWLENIAEGWRMPERIVLLDWLPHQTWEDRSGPGNAQFVVNSPIPKEVFDGDPSGAGPQYVVHMEPNIRMKLHRLPGLH
jgi:hypothetical protein